MKPNKKIKVFMVDDDNQLIDAIVNLLEGSSVFEFLDRANGPTECLQKLKDIVSDIDIILMDVDFPGKEKDGILLSKEIRQLYPGASPRIVFMSVGSQALVDPQNGFHGLIPKNQGIGGLMEMLKNICLSGAVYPPPKKKVENPFDRLTPRQRKIFCLFLQGSSIDDIAKELHVSATTINSHKRVIFSKVKQLGITEDKMNDPATIKIAKKNNICTEVLNTSQLDTLL